MEIVGRITTGATVKILEDSRTVIHFSIAVNDRYKSKNGAVVKVTTFYNCSYWRNPKRADLVRKGTLLQVTGRLSVHAYIGADGNAKASLDFHVNSINILSFPKEVEYLGKAISPSDSREQKEDIPF
ncbi:MAG TPA: single-stranded DNA-binding protein [Flavisolibacter sp.]|nr:single-stranded DNA-binding protein [Flavisolibacter sp.]